MIRLTIPSIEQDDVKAVEDTLLSGFLVQGSRVAEFERQVAARAGASFGVAVSNCTAALHLSLLALNVRPGDIVIVTAYSWIATANVIELCGAQPVFVDIRSDTFNMDTDILDSILNRLMSNCETARKVKAILPVHVFGSMADMSELMELADRYEIPVIEDAACALGAALDGRPAGSWGSVGCFSFHPRKAITTGEGGMIVTQRAEIARFAKALRNHGQDPESSSSEFIMPGFNYRLTEIQAALGLTQMAKLDRIIADRRKLAGRYDRLLNGSGLIPQAVSSRNVSVYQSYIVLLPEERAGKRDEIIRIMKMAGVETTIGTWHMPLTSYFRSRYGYRRGDYPVTDRVFDRSLTLPLYERLSESDQAQVVEILKGTLAGR